MKVIFYFRNKDTGEYLESTTPIAFTKDDLAATHLAVDLDDDLENSIDDINNVIEAMLSYDIDLSLQLRKIFHSQDGIVRSIMALENEKFIDGALYYSESVPVEHRKEWHQHALHELSSSDLIFLDPDNGMIVPSAEKDKQKQRKYVLDAEVKDYLSQGHSVLIYQHRLRVNEMNYIDRMMQRFMSLSSAVKRSDIQVITFPRYSIRDYFAISMNEGDRLKINKAITNMLNGIWGSGKKPMCRLPIGAEKALSSETPNSPTKL